MAFGAVRKAYKAPCKFFTDDPTADNQIIWYNVPDNTPIYDGWTVFTPRVDTPPNEATSAHEAEGLGRILRTFYDGDDDFGFAGTHVHGDDEDFRGLSPRAKYFVDDVPPQPPCADIRHTVAFEIGLEVEDVTDLRCACCEDVDSPETFTLFTESPGIPMFDGLEVDMELITAGPNCIWNGFVEVGSGGLNVTVTANESTPHELVLAWQWIGVDFDTYTGDDDVFGEEEFNCNPWMIDTTTDAFHNFEATGETVRFRTHPSPNRPAIVAFAVGLEQLTVASPGRPHEVGLAIGLVSMDP